ncbi:MAG: PAS domain-containing protein [Deinococcales bacterium]
MTLVRNPYAAVLLLSAFALLALAAAARVRASDIRGGRALAGLALAGMAWTLALALWVTAGAGADGQLALRLVHATAALVPWALMAFALRATRTLPRFASSLLWLLAVPTLAVIALAFGPVGGLSLWRTVVAVASAGGVVAIGVPTAYGALATVFAGALVAGAVVVLALALERAPVGGRVPLAWTLAGVGLPVLAEVVAELLGAVAPDALPAGLAWVPPGALLVAPAAWAVAHGLFAAARYRLEAVEPGGVGASSDVSGSRRGELADHLEQPVLLVDRGWRVRYANAAAGRLFRREGGLGGVQVGEFFADVPAVLTSLAQRRSAVVELELPRSGTARTLEARLTPLSEPSGRYAGTLLTLIDVGRARRAEVVADVVEGQARRHELLLEALQEGLRAVGRGEPLGLLLDIVLTRAAAALETPHGALYLADPVADVLRRRTAVGGFEALDEPPLRREEGLAGRAWASSHGAAVQGPLQHPVEGLVQGPGRSGAADGEMGVAVAVPMRLGGQTLGVLMLARPRGDARPFEPDEVDALRRFAELAALAVRDARTAERSAQADGELAWLDRLDAAITRAAPDTAVLDLALTAAREAARFDRAVVWLAVEGGRALEARAWLGLPLGAESSQRVPLDGSAPLLEESFRGGHEIVLQGGGPLPARLRPEGPAATGPLKRPSWPVVVPVRGLNEVVGVLVADDGLEGADLEARLRALRRIVARAGQALDRARLHEEARCQAGVAERTRAQLQGALAAREALLDALPMAYFETDLRGRLTRASEELARLVGVDEGSLQGVPLAELTAGGEGALTELFGRVLRGGRVARRSSWALLARRGAVVPVELSIGLLRDPAGEAVGYFGLARPRGR